MQSDRNLLFGVTALQLALIDSRQFADACCGWAVHGDQALGELLAERGWLQPEDRRHVESLVERKLLRNAGVPRPGGPDQWGDFLQEALAEVDDPQANPPMLRSPSETSTLPGSSARLERYTLTRLHARGGIGQVWLARDETLGRDVALKELQPKRNADPGSWSRFLREAKITGQLEHPGIVPIYELGRGQPSHDATDGGQIRPPSAEQAKMFYTMRFIKGRTLSDAVHDYHCRRAEGKTTPLEMRELVQAFMAVCNTVAYAHSRGVIHRDLKGANVVLGDFGEVIVLDWGLAKVLPAASSAVAAPLSTDDPYMTIEAPAPMEQLELNTECAPLTLQGQVMGTPAFMAPEQAAGQLDRIDQRTDVYGLGAMLYELLTGQAPFKGDDSLEVLHRVVHEPPIPPREIVHGRPPALAAICLKAIAKRAEDRYGSATELARDVQCWLADEPVTAWREPFAVRAGRWVRRRRSLVTAAAALLVMAAAFLAVSTLVVRQERDEKARALARAETNFHLARDAVNQSFVLVSESPDLKAHSLEPLRRRLLETARKFYERFVQEHAGTPELRFDLAWATLRLADIESALGRRGRAEELCIEAREAFDDLCRSQPARPEYQAGLANCHRQLGSLHAVTGAAAKAEAAYRRALEIEERLVEEHPTVALYRTDLASTHNALGLLQQTVGSLDGAVASFQRALTLHQQVAHVEPTSEHRGHVSVVWINLGAVYTRLKAFEKAIAANKEVIHLAEDLLRVEPTNPDHQRAQALGYLNLGLAYHESHRPAEALDASQKALPLWQSLADAHPLVLDYREMLAATHANMGLNYRVLGRRAEGIDSYRKALPVQERLVEEQPQVLAYRVQLASLFYQLATRAMDEQDKREASLSDYKKAIAAVDRVLAQEPRHDRARTLRCLVLSTRAFVLANLGRTAEAVKDIDEAEAMKEDRDPVPRWMRAVALSILGDHPRALREADALAALENLPAPYFYNLACLYGRAAAAGADDKLPAPERAQRAEQLAAKGVSLLVKAGAAGFFKDPSSVEQLKKDSDLDALRNRPDFKKLLQDAAGKPD